MSARPGRRWRPPASSTQRLFRALQARQGLVDGDDSILATLLPAERTAPIVTVLDGHPHTLSFLSAVEGAPIVGAAIDLVV